MITYFDHDLQIGSVVAPRKVIDTYLIESSPKHGKTSELVHDDPIANTSSRKRKAIMLNIENVIIFQTLPLKSGLFY